MAERPAASPDYAVRIKALRTRYGLTQVALAHLLGVSFASVNRWENGHSRPIALAWRQIARLEAQGPAALAGDVDARGEVTS